ncbi:MAG: hypothetical protein LAP21_07690 [Acidobacteriia bacterium]|nr:hypothetical protein [Terriglobia bacterium]
MKKSMCICLAVALLSAMTAAQSPAKSAAASRPMAKRVVEISGEVSDDGSTLVSNEINKWTVMNAASLKGYEGASVTVRCRVDPDQHTIQVLSVAPQRVSKSNPGDSAFRR